MIPTLFLICNLAPLAFGVIAAASLGLILEFSL